jgi:hypothetical protein
MLVVGHPGHELRVHGWLEALQPVVMVLTDGSGHTGVSRLDSTAKLIARAGAGQGPIFGRMSDAELYRAMLAGEHQPFLDLADELAASIVRERIAIVAGDDAEGFNPTHDVCRLLVNAAVRLSRAQAAPTIVNLAFDLMEAPDDGSARQSGRRDQLRLDEGALARKLEAALDYPEMAAEVAAARSKWGDEAFRVETFRHADAAECWTPGADPPYYERYGAERVSAGVYRDVIRYDQHMRPLADGLAAHRGST